jgi:hypothetical protein
MHRPICLFIPAPVQDLLPEPEFKIHLVLVIRGPVNKFEIRQGPGNDHDRDLQWAPAKIFERFEHSGRFITP